jgi:ATP adenylyltransferase
MHRDRGPNTGGYRMVRLTLDDYETHDDSNDEDADGCEVPIVAGEGARLAGVPDEFQRLWTPHRMVYIRHGQQPSREECPFCVAPRLSDDDGLIVARGTRAFVLLNLFPYNSGHLLVCPYRHIASYDLATPDEVADIGSLTQVAIRVVQEVAHNDGFNMGINQGAVAGAGIAGHLHQHIVPRWKQDANFLPIIAKTKALPQLLGDVRRKLAEAWPMNPSS